MAPRPGRLYGLREHNRLTYLSAVSEQSVVQRERGSPNDGGEKRGKHQEVSSVVLMNFVNRRCDDDVVANR